MDKVKRPNCKSIPRRYVQNQNPESQSNLEDYNPSLIERKITVIYSKPTFRVLKTEVYSIDNFQTLEYPHVNRIIEPSEKRTTYGEEIVRCDKQDFMIYLETILRKTVRDKKVGCSFSEPPDKK